jgi:hypothetical protein
MKRLAAKLTAVVVLICSVCLLTLSSAHAEPDFIWCNRMSDLLQSYQTSYPVSDFEPYFEKQAGLQEATARSDNAALRAGITDVIRMVRPSNIDHDAAVELINYLYVWRATLTTPDKYTRYARSK